MCENAQGLFSVEFPNDAPVTQLQQRVQENQSELPGEIQQNLHDIAAGEAAETQGKKPPQSVNGVVFLYKDGLLDKRTYKSTVNA